MTPARFRNLVFAHYKKHGRRGLPWRKTQDAYYILVSEIMLQQTQVERVLPFYDAFLKEFPTINALAAAPLSRVLIRWQGLGYNRRAKMLHDAARAVALDYGGTLPKSVIELETLPGIGHYTARAIAAFAYNEDVVFVETNLRTAVTHHFFPNEAVVHDREVLAILARVLPKGRSREWYAALMDYGSFLKRSGIRINTKQKGYVKQPAFTGSDREVRGALLKALSQQSLSEARLLALFGVGRREQVRTQLSKLETEGLLEKVRGTYQLPA